MFFIEWKFENVYDVDVDIVFLVDFLGSVGRENFGKLKDFVNNVVCFLNLVLGRFRVVVIFYSSFVWLVIGFSGYFIMWIFKVDVDKFLFVGGLRRIDCGLDVVVILLENVFLICVKVVIVLIVGK